MSNHLVTGGAGYFGERLASLIQARGDTVRVLDLNPPSLKGVEFVQADIRDAEAVRRACRGVDTVYHNVAQVPLARDRNLFWSVNRDGTKAILDAARDERVNKLVYTSSSAVFGVPKSNPVTEESEPSPAEDYGKAKFAGELLCREAASQGLDVTIIRPRTIIGHGRLGIFEILFDWISKGRDVPVFDGGSNLYQFVHTDDLARACIAAGNRAGFAVYNIGAVKFGTMRELLQGLIDHAHSLSRIRSIPMRFAQIMMDITSAIGLSPLGPYHSLMYGRSMYFDVSKAQREIAYQPQWGQVEALCQSYDWYLANRDMTISGPTKSHHQSATKKKVLSLAPYVLSLFPQP